MIRRWVIAVAFLLVSPLAFSQSDTVPANASAGESKKVLQDKLAAEFKLTKVSNDRNDIVTPGSILVLQKDGLQMCGVNARAPFPSTYKDGKLSTGFGEELGWGMVAGDTKQIARRKFVAGEKFWVTAFVVHDDGVIFQFYSDPYQDIRYYANVKIAFAKHNMPPPEVVLKAIADVITVQPDENAAANAPQPAPPTQQQAIAPIPPPPPPADAPPPQPKMISAGETKEQVVAIMGQPQKVVNLGKKEIDYYPDMKVIFVQGKVSDVQ